MKKKKYLKAYIQFPTSYLEACYYAPLDSRFFIIFLVAFQSKKTFDRKNLLFRM